MFLQVLVLIVVVDMAIAFLMGCVSVKMGTLVLTVQLVIDKIFFAPIS